MTKFSQWLYHFFCRRGMIFFCLVSPILLQASPCKATQVPNPASGHYFHSFDGTRIYYEDRGSGYPVLLIHGFIVDGQSWKGTKLYQDLLQSGYRVIIPDLRGNGRSDHPHDQKAYSHDAEARDLMALITRLHLKKYMAVGYSRGSIILARLLVRDKRLQAAVLGGMGADFTQENWPRRIQFYHALSGQPEKGLEGMVQYIQKKGLDQKALALEQKEQPSTSARELGKITIPVLVICGDHDEENGSPVRLSRMIPGSKLVRVPGIHNTTSGSAPFGKAVMNFLKKAAS
ncbi:MAG: alpha/beta fold hydrolase [Chitinophagaceae bacterium]